MWHSSELIDVKELTLLLWVGHVNGYTTESSVVVDAARPDLCGCSAPNTL